MNVQLQIEEIILHGFTMIDRHRISVAVEQELTRLFVEQGVPPTLANGGALAKLDGGAFSVAANAKPQQIGAQVAQAIYKGLTR